MGWRPVRVWPCTRCASRKGASPLTSLPALAWACSRSPSAAAWRPTSATPWPWVRSTPWQPACSSPAQRATPARPTPRSLTPPRLAMLPLIYGSGRDNASKFCLSGTLDPATHWMKKLRAIRDGERIRRFAHRGEVVRVLRAALWVLRRETVSSLVHFSLAEGDTGAAGHSLTDSATWDRINF
jgi:hypothetical protein